MNEARAPKARATLRYVSQKCTWLWLSSRTYQPANGTEMTAKPGADASNVSPAWPGGFHPESPPHDPHQRSDRGHDHQRREWLVEPGGSILGEAREAVSRDPLEVATGAELDLVANAVDDPLAIDEQHASTHFDAHIPARPTAHPPMAASMRCAVRLLATRSPGDIAPNPAATTQSASEAGIATIRSKSAFNAPPSTAASPATAGDRSLLA